MKKSILFLVALTYTFAMYAQNEAHLKETQLKQQKTSTVLNREAKKVIEIPCKTAFETSNIVEVAIVKSWVNPDEDISGEVFGRYKKINGGAPILHISVIITQSQKTRVSIVVDFQDGKLMYTFDAAVYVDPSQYSKGGYYPIKHLTKRNNGKVNKINTENIQSMNQFVNSFITEILKAQEEKLAAEVIIKTLGVDYQVAF